MHPVLILDLILQCMWPGLHGLRSYSQTQLWSLIGQGLFGKYPTHSAATPSLRSKDSHGAAVVARGGEEGSDMVSLIATNVGKQKCPVLWNSYN